MAPRFERPAGQEINPRLQKIGVERLSIEQMREVGTSFGEHLKAGLEGHHVSLKTIPTYLQPVDLAKIDPSKKALGIDMGGSNIYRGFIQVKDGVPELTSSVRVPYNAEKKRKYASTEEFFTEVAAAVEPLLHEDISAVGIIWSFPGDAFPTGKNIDVISTDALTKEFVIPGIHDRPIGEYLMEALRNSNPALSANLPRIVTNDTAAVLTANGALLGGVDGTGFNVAGVLKNPVTQKPMIYNFEAGGFSAVPTTSLTEAVDRESDKPGLFLAEKQISGGYINKLFMKATEFLGLGTTHDIKNEDISMLLSGNAQNILQKLPNLSPDDIVLLRDQAQILCDRSAQLVASIVTGTIEAFPEDFQDGPIQMPIEGSFFGLTPGYKEAVARYTKELTDREIMYVPVDLSGIKGAGVAALGLLQ